MEKKAIYEKLGNCGAQALALRIHLSRQASTLGHYETFLSNPM